MSAPTDLELMLYADDELDGPRRAEVEAWLTGNTTARAKLDAMGSVGEVVRAGASAQVAPVGLTDAILAAASDATSDATARRQEPPVDLAARRAKRHAEGIGRFYAVAATLVAAAAALLVWTRHEDGRALPSVAPPSVPVSVSVTQAPTSDPPTSEHGVEVWSVDFGTASGAVLYVPSESSRSGTTTVVWLSSDEASDEASAE